MNRSEAARLLAHAAAFDNRQPSQAAAEAWAAALHDVPLDADTLAAVARYYGTPTPDKPDDRKWIQPHHVRTGRQALREARFGSLGPGLSAAIPAADPDDVPGYLRALRAQRTAEADGHDVPALPAGAPDFEPATNPHVRQILDAFAARKAAAQRRRVAEQEAEREAIRAYVDATGYLLTLDDHGTAALAAAREALLGDDQAAQGFPLAADRLGVTDEHKVFILAAELAQETS